MTLILDADAEQLVVDYLTATGPARGLPTSVGTRVPNPRPAECITVFRTGGPRRDLVTDAPQLTIECRAATETRAAQIAYLVRALVNDLWSQTLGGHAVYEVEELSGPGNLPDPISNGPRYSQTFVLFIRAASLT